MVRFREEKAVAIAAIGSLVGESAISCFLLVYTWEPPYIPLRVLFILLAAAGMLMATFIFAAFITTIYTISSNFLAEDHFGKHREISRENIRLITKETLGKEEYLVVYPLDVDESTIESHLSPKISDAKRQKLVFSNDKILSFKASKKNIDLLEGFSYEIV